jgi:hypothetical protein
MAKQTPASSPTVLISFLLLLASCQHAPEINIENERKILLSLDEQARQFHFTKNAKAMAEGVSTDFMSINKGVISKPTYNESFTRFDSYFKSVEFIKWDNKTAPVIRFSDDASLAYVAVDKLVVLKLKDDVGNAIFDTSEFAWLSVFKKINNQWKLDCIASTNK